MRLSHAVDGEVDMLDQLAGITGVGWTTSILAYGATVLGYGSSILPRVIVELQVLLILGCMFFVATIGLDELRRTRSKGEL